MSNSVCALDGCYGPCLISTNGLNVCDCQVCGHAHLVPRPTSEELDTLYQSEYYQFHNVGWFEKECREQWYWQPVYWARIRQFERIANPVPTESIFDFGAGCGWFIKAVQEYAPEYTVAGFEPNSEARLYAKQHILGRSAPAMLLDKPNFCFNEAFIHASLVLEHILDPLAYLQEFHHRLRLGGALCVVAPNEFNPLQKRLTARYDYSPVHPHHVNYFTPESLQTLVERAGFKVVRVTSTFPIEQFVLRGLNYIKYPRLGLVAHWLRMVIEWAGLSFASRHWERRRDRWAARGIGREIELWAVKGT